jgi:hypothetical protein
MKADQTRLWRILGFAALLFIAISQGLHASEILLSSTAESECHHHHSDTSPRKCPVEHSCCHAHFTGMVLIEAASGLPLLSCRAHHFSVGDDSVPDGCLREIDYPPQLS